MIIHITREIRQVIIYGANGSEAAVREFFHQHEVDNMVVCRPNDDEYLAPELLEECLIGMLRASLSGEEEIAVYVH